MLMWIFGIVCIIWRSLILATKVNSSLGLTRERGNDRVGRKLDRVLINMPWIHSFPT